MQLNRGDNSERGLTLFEVLFALFISSILLMTALRLITEQWRSTRMLKGQMEAHYAVMVAGKTLSDAVRSAKTVEWIVVPGVLKVLPMPITFTEKVTPFPPLEKEYDKFFIDDKDRDGTKDLYWNHLGVSEPLVSMTSWTCTEVEAGLWEIVLEASVDGQSALWKSTIRQRNHPPAPFLGASQRVMSVY